MTRPSAAFAALVLGGCSSAAIDGTLTDGLTKKGVSDVRIVAKATSPDASMTCQAFETTTGADGSFAIDGACTGTAYALSLGDDSWWVPDLAEVPDGGATGLALEAWRSSQGSGVYKLSGDSFDGVRTAADVKSETILNTEEKVRFPWPTVPSKVPLVKADEHLVLVGPKTVDTFEILPLIKSETRKFGNKESWVTMDPWYYIGVKFTDDETFERVTATVDESKIISKKAGERAVKYVPGSAVEEGRYVVLAPDSKVVTIVDFGKTWKAPDDREAAADGG